MPMYIEPREAGPRLGAHGSVAVEIDWALSGALRLGQKAMRPELEDLYTRQAGLVEDVAGLWGPDESLSYPGFLELSILAFGGGQLFSLDSDALLGSLEALCTSPPGHLVLAAETKDDRERVLQRLHVLRTSAKRRRHYLEVVTRVWSALRPAWEAIGRPAVQAAVAARETAISRNPDWREYANDCKSHDLGGLVEALGPGGELAVVPAYFTHTGLLMDLPGLVVVGIGTGDTDAGARERTEQMARRLKAVADPTRLAIMAGLARNEMTVTEIANRFDLAQPTVSNHVKLLRDAGFVTVRNDGRSRILQVDREALGVLGRQVQELLGLTATLPET